VRRRADHARDPLRRPAVTTVFLNRLELSRAEPIRHHKIGHGTAVIESLFVDLFLDAHSSATSGTSRRPGAPPRG
jgi:hypothetical protein